MNDRLPGDRSAGFLETNQDRTSGVESVEWHFFTHSNNSLGPDPALLDRLERQGIGYTTWVP